MRYSWILLTLTLVGCADLKPELTKEHDPDETTLPGIFTGEKGEYSLLRG